MGIPPDPSNLRQYGRVFKPPGPSAPATRPTRGAASASAAAMPGESRGRRQASAPSTWASVWPSASSHSPRCSRTSDSTENAEKVVKPPSKPVTSSRRSSSFGRALEPDQGDADQQAADAVDEQRAERKARASGVEPRRRQPSAAARRRRRRASHGDLRPGHAQASRRRRQRAALPASMPQRASAASSATRASTQRAPAACRLLLPERRLRLQVVHQELAGLERLAAMRRGDRHQHDLVARLQRADAVDRRARARMSKRAQRLVDHRLDRRARSCRGSARAPSRRPPAPSLRSRTVPMKLATAPTPRIAGAQRRDLGAEVEVVVLDRDARARHADSRQPPVTGGKKPTSAPSPSGALSRRRGRWFSALRTARLPAPAPRRGGRRGRSARRAARRRVAPAPTSTASLRRRGPRAARRSSAPATFMCSSSANGRKRTVSPRAIVVAAGVVDQAVGPDRRGQHPRALVREQLEPAVGVAAHAQELAPPVGLAASRSRRASRSAAARRSVAPCRRSSTGRTASRKVTKLDTGLPGRPMNQRRRAVAAAHLAERERLARLDRDLPQVEPPFGLRPPASGGLPRRPTRRRR